MKLILKDEFALRGWLNYPHALVFYPTGEITILNDLQFQSLTFCDGITDIDSVYVLNSHREQIKKYLDKGIVKKCDSNEEIKDYQRYKEYNCQYIKHAHWAITRNCNYLCKHCYMSSPGVKHTELSYEQCERVISQLEKCGILSVSLTGGEPLLRTDFLKIINTLIDKKINLRSVYTNGSLINSKLLDELDKLNIKPAFSISFDGLGHHDWLRGIKGAEKATIKAIKLLHKKGFKIEIEMCLHKNNADTIESTVDFLAGLGVESIKINQATESGEWVKEGTKYSLTVKEVYDLYLDYIPKFFKKGSPVTLQLGGFFYCEKNGKIFNIPAVRFSGKESCLSDSVCSHAKNIMYINPDGQILPCVSLDGMKLNQEKIFITEMELSDALTHSDYLSLINLNLQEFLSFNKKCNNCEHKLVCGGGCRGLGAMKKGEYFDNDSTACIFFKNDYLNKIKKCVSDFVEI